MADPPEVSKPALPASTPSKSVNDAAVNSSDEDSDDVFGASSVADAWERSKENVLPLRSGRKLASLNSAVTRDSVSEDPVVREQRHEYEAELRATEASDAAALLDVWHRYVGWTEQNFTTGKEMNEILQRSLQAFPQDSGFMAKLADDPKYVDIWLKLADARDDPMDIFSFMYGKKIGLGLSVFYEHWAWHLEDSGNTKKASAVLSKGITNGVQPVEHLQRLKRELESRVARDTMRAMEDARFEGPDEASQRRTLGELRGVGKNKTAPHSRVGPAAMAPPRRVGGLGSVGGVNKNLSNSFKRPSASNAPSHSTGSFSIFSDEATYSDAIPDNPLAANPVDETIRVKENTQKPVTWNKARVKQKSTALLSTPMTPGFDIHVDADAEATPSTPAKPIDMTHSRPLSVKKMPKDGSGTSSAKGVEFLLRGETVKESERLMFCKDKVYQGLEEFSFEEIRVERWKRNKTLKE